MNLDDILAAATKVKDDVLAGSYVLAVEDAVPLLQGFTELLRGAGFLATPGNEAKATAVKEALGEAHAGCGKVGAAGGVFPGDGSFLKALLALLLQILPLVAPFLDPTPPPAP